MQGLNMKLGVSSFECYLGRFMKVLTLQSTFPLKPENLQNEDASKKTFFDIFDKFCVKKFKFKKKIQKFKFFVEKCIRNRHQNSDFARHNFFPNKSKIFEPKTVRIFIFILFYHLKTEPGFCKHTQFFESVQMNDVEFFTTNTKTLRDLISCRKSTPLPFKQS